MRLKKKQKSYLDERSKVSFLRGYEAMLNKLNPQTIIYFGEPLPEMQGNSYQMCGDAFQKAPIFDGRTFWEIEKEIEWVDA